MKIANKYKYLDCKAFLKLHKQILGQRIEFKITSHESSADNVGLQKETADFVRTRSNYPTSLNALQITGDLYDNGNFSSLNSLAYFYVTETYCPDILRDILNKICPYC